MVVEAHNSTYKGEITPVEPIYFRPFIGATRYTLYKTGRGAHLVHVTNLNYTPGASKLYQIDVSWGLFGLNQQPR